MADHITHIHGSSAPADESGTSAFMIVVLLVAVLALGAFVYYVALGANAPAVRNADPNSVNLDVNLPTPAPANTPPTGTAPQY